MGKEESCPTAWFQERFGQADEESSNHTPVEGILHATGLGLPLQPYCSLALAEINLWEVWFWYKCGGRSTVTAAGVISQLCSLQADFSSAFSWSPQVHTL